MNAAARAAATRLPIVIGLLAAAPMASLAQTPCLDLNAATRAEIESARSVGVELAERILQARQHGRFADWDDLRRRVKGLSRRAREGLEEAGFQIGSKPPAAGPCQGPRDVPSGASGSCAGTGTGTGTGTGSGTSSDFG